MLLVQRYLSNKLQQYLRLFPIVVITGARQAGKTTFAKLELTDWNYFDLEKPEDYNRISYDTPFFLKEYGENCIIDEAQILPELFPVLRSYIDAGRDKKGRLVLLGSVNPMLVSSISESLAGRVGFLELAPFRYEEYKEIIENKRDIDFQKFWLYGGYPEPIKWEETEHSVWIENYLKTFTQRDVLKFLKTRMSYQKQLELLTIIAHCHGKLWNASQVASILGVSYKTINNYIDIMEQFFLVRRLRPFLPNIKKRISKSPKLYYRDSGILHYLLNIRTFKSLNVSPYRGFSFEGFILEELIKKYNKRTDVNPNVYFFRTAVGDEIDIILETDRGIEAFEVKTTTTITKETINKFMKNLDQLGLAKGTILYLGENSYKVNEQIQVRAAVELIET